MGCVVRKIEKERLLLVCRLFLNVIDSPTREDLGGVAIGFHFLLVEAHPIDAAAKVFPVVVHHVGEETMEEIKTTVIGDVGRLETKMPFADHASVVAGLV